MTKLLRTFCFFMLVPGLVLAQSRPQKTDASVDETASKPDAPRETDGNREHLGSVNPENLAPLFEGDAVSSWFARHRIRSYGWFDGGGTYSSSGDDLLSVAPEPNRYGNRFLLNGAWLIFERPLAQEGWQWGFRTDFYAGSDAALLRPMNSFGPQGKRFGTDFRQLNLTIHMPILTSRGVDLLLGRTNVPLGFETLMAPYRPMYSQTYFWINFQVAATMAYATLHLNRSLDVVGGTAMGYNTVFKLRGRAPAYIGRVLYHPRASPRTTLIGTVFTGPRTTPWAAGHSGNWQTVGELLLKHDWNPRFIQVFQVNSSLNTKDPAIHGRNDATHGAFTIATFHLTKTLDLNARQEWFTDHYGVHTGVPGHFHATTLGLNVMPLASINFRPEVRWDGAGQRSFGPATVPLASRAREQWTVAADLIIKFKAFN